MSRVETVAAVLDAPDDFDAWRKRARSLILAGIAPEQAVWVMRGEGAEDLFAGAGLMPDPPALSDMRLRVSRAFVETAELALLHQHKERFALLYRVLWRLQGQPRLMEDTADRDVYQMHLLVRSVRRDIHKMRAFVRFRVVADEDGVDQYVAWFEPEHHIVRRNAGFFLNRFAAQRWSILTPDLCLHWDGKEITETGGACREDAPSEDASEDLWLRYYASILNPARLKVSAMTREMPRKYWVNLPEAQLIPELIASAQAREAGMVAGGVDLFKMPEPKDLEEIARGIDACRRCAIGCTGVRATPGEGPADAGLMIVGEQPGDMEERAGRPFVGPAGQLLNRHLAEAGFDRRELRVTNAVKHFKFVQRGKRRMHQNPSARETDICRWWLDAERKIVRPRVILALGATAGRAILGRTPSIGRERGAAIPLGDGSTLWITVHPSAILRVPDSLRETEEAAFQSDLRRVRRALDPNQAPSAEPPMKNTETSA